MCSFCTERERERTHGFGFGFGFVSVERICGNTSAVRHERVRECTHILDDAGADESVCVYVVVICVCVCSH